MDLPDASTERRADFAFSGVVVAAIALMTLFYVAFEHLASLLLVSALLAYALLPLVDKLAKRLPRALAVAIVGVGVLTVLGGAVAISVPLVSKQLENSGEITARAKDMSNKAWTKAKGVLPVAVEQKAEEAKDSAVKKVKEPGADDNAKYAGWAKKVGSALSSFASGLVFIPLFVVLMLFGFHRLGGHLMRAVPRPWQRRFEQRNGELDDALSGFVRGQLLNAMILAVLYAIAFTVIGIPLGIVVGLFAGFGELIPYVGNAIGLGLGVLLSFAGGQPMDAVWVVVTFAALQALEAFVLAPMVVGKKAKIRPIALLIALALGGELFGVVGLLLAVPVTAALKVALKVFISAWQRTTFFEQGRREQQA